MDRLTVLGRRRLPVPSTPPTTSWRVSCCHEPAAPSCTTPRTRSQRAVPPKRSAGRSTGTTVCWTGERDARAPARGCRVAGETEATSAAAAMTRVRRRGGGRSWLTGSSEGRLAAAALRRRTGRARRRRAARRSRTTSTTASPGSGTRTAGPSPSTSTSTSPSSTRTSASTS
ncbi:Vicilin-like seed storage protein [Zea mays]|uniref:Vicilin-like seed storage protein n=1 Tax=Zea mays TaxID=4577 RepID=A0A1D6K270_MAIZE|nr:Vicilin-like seed storage protein [Zea mays]